MIFEHGELPDGLLKAHRSGRLVLFIGSGASAGSPTDLPDFACLAKQVIAELEADRELTPADYPEFVLSDIAADGFGVHAAVHRIIGAADQPNPTHHAIAELAQSSPPARIVTTNYDRLLTECGLADIPEYSAPDLPGDEAFEGIVYLHGSVADEPQHLVVTRADFARAYMALNSPTLAFLHRLFTSSPVLFIGYSANDVLMNYLLQGARGRTELYALRSGTDGPRQDELGIYRIPYGDHQNLPSLLQDWSKFAGATWQEHRERVGRIVTRPQATAGMSLHEESYLAHVVAEPSLVDQFIRQAQGGSWCRWIASLPTQDFFDPEPPPESTTARLQFWFSQQVSSDDFTADDVARLCDKGGGTLPNWVWYSMFNPARFLRRQNPDAASRCLVALADVAPPAYREPCARTIRTFLGRTTQLSDDLFVELAATWCEMISGLVGFRDGSDQVSDFWSQRPRIAAELMTVVNARLHRVNRLTSIYGGTDVSLMRAKVDGQRGGDLVHRGHLLVDAARDLMDILLRTAPTIAAGYLEVWAKSRWPILNRLALHGWTQRRDLSPADKLNWLTARHHLVDDHRLSHEMSLLISSLESALSASNTAPLRARLVRAQTGRSAKVRFERHLLVTDKDGMILYPTWRAAGGFNDPHQSRLYEHRRPYHPVTTAVADVCHELSGPGTDEPWAGLRSYVASCSEPERIALVQAAGDGVLDMAPGQRSDQWRRWMRCHWQQRLASDPVVLTDDEAAAFADWAGLVHGDDFVEAAQLVMRRRTDLHEHSVLPRLLLDAIAADAGHISVIDEHPQQVVQLLAHVLEHSEPDVVRSFEFAVPELHEALSERTEPSELAPLDEQMARLGVS